jgi:hypothetical protein
MLRNILAVLLGILVAGLSVAAIEALGHRVYPPPAGLDPGDPEAFAAAIREMPLPALLFVPLAWFLGTTAGAAVAANISHTKKLQSGLIVGVVMLAGGLGTLVLIPHPLWLSVLGVLVFFPATWIGSRLTAV